MGAINIKVIGNSGNGVKAKYGASVSGLLGGHVKGGYTNSDGHGVIEWSSNSPLDCVYIEGKEYKGKYTSGNTYVFKR